MSVRFGHEITGDLRVAETREWLVTNGIGGYASGSAAGSITRGYHGLLVAALRPPIDRRLMLVKLDETLNYRGSSFELASNRWAGGSVAPTGHLGMQSFELEGSVPRWRFTCADALIDKRIWMEQGSNTTFVSYTLVSAAGPAILSARAIVDNRVFHNTGDMAWPLRVTPIADGVRVESERDGALPLTLRMTTATVVAGSDVYRGFQLPAEAARGLWDQDSHVHAATFSATIQPGETLLFMASAEADPVLDPGALARRRAHEASLLETWRAARSSGSGQAGIATPEWMAQLVLAADQFVVARAEAGSLDGRSVIAGYHWFEDWGRDTMISLPGLTLATGRPQDAAPVLETFARYIDQGMLPNRFPDAAETPQYNTIDATLWYFEAIRAYHEATRDDALLGRLFPKLRDIIDWHLRGTRYDIHVDPADGLLYGGQPGVQLTWMDAKVGNQVITPRIGKPVEVNALWYNALVAMAGFAERLGEPAIDYHAMAERALAGFQRFWNAGAGYCFDVLDGPGGAESLLRPNQLLAVSLPASPLPSERQVAVVDACARALLTSHGLRSLAPTEAGYQGHYGGDQASRDGAYHQGTVWAWLIGPFVTAHLRVHGDPQAALRLLEPFGDHLLGAGLGTVSEIFDGDAPFSPRGCIAQAWSVAEILRAFDAIERHSNQRGNLQ